MVYVKINFEDKCDSMNLLLMQIGNQLECFHFLGSNTIYFLTVYDFGWLCHYLLRNY